MHQTMKKVCSFLLTLCLIVGVLPLSANAALVDGDQYIIQQLSLGEDLVLHLRASLPDSAASLANDAVGTITYAGKTSTYTLDDLTPDENGMYDMPVEMAVAEMTDDIHAVVNAEVLGINQEIINEHYTIRDYLVSIIEGDSSQTTKNMALELLNMGAWAQIYFNHNISDLANANYSTSAANAVPEKNPSIGCTGTVEGIQYYGTSVRLLSQAAARFYFEAEGGVDGYTFTIGDTQYEPVAKDGMYYIETPGISHQNMSDVITVNVTDGTDTLSVSYAPIWYFVRTYNNLEDDYTKALMEAAYSYYKTAESYKTQICMDVEISTLSGNYDSIALGFYPLDFEGDINNQVDIIEVPTGTTYTVKLDQGEYLIDGEFKGIGITVLSGPAWDSKLEDGSDDRHNIQISNLRLEGPEDRTIDLSFATIANGTADTGYTNAASGGIGAVTDGIITFSNGYFTDGYKITFNEVGTYLKLDMEISTLSGNYESIGIGFYPYDFEGDINDHIDKIEVPTGTTYTVKLDLSKYLADGEFPGIGFAVLGGPTWDATLEDGTYDRHNITVSNIRLEGELNQSIDLSKASLKSGQDGTGYTNANAGGTAAVADGIVSISNGFFTDGYKLLFVDETIPEETEPTETEPTETEPTETEPTETEPTEPEPTDPPATEPDTAICIDMQFTTLGGSTDPVEIGFYPYNYEGDINGQTDKITVTAGEQTTVKLDAEKYLVDGELTGLGFVVFGGPAWDAKLPDGYTPDRHTVTISGIYLEGEQSTVYDLSKSAWVGGNDGGYTNANGSGAATIGSQIVISNGFQYDGHKITLVEDTNTYLCMDMNLTTLGDSTDPVNIRLYNYNYEGSVGDGYTDLVTVNAGATTKIKVKVDNYLVDGELPGFGVAIFGGPEWNTQLEDGTYDRHSVVISNVRLEGVQERSIELSCATVATGTNGTGFTWANSGGAASVVDGKIVITGGFMYDAHEITFNEPDTYLKLDMDISTLSGSYETIGIGFYPYNFEGDINNYIDKIEVPTGTTYTVKLDASKYLIDGEFPGIGFAVLGGPAWDAKLEDGTTPDRHNITVSNIRLEGELNQSIDLSKASLKSGQDGTGYTNANAGGTATVTDGIVSVANGFFTDGYKLTFVDETTPEEPEPTDPEPTDPPATEPDTAICIDMQFTTLGGSTDPVEIGFYPYNYEGDINGQTDKITVTAGEQTTVKLDAEKYLVDGELTGLGFAIFGGPAWDAKLPDGYTPDRHTITISGIYLEGEQSTVYDLSQSVWAGGTNGTGFTNANGSGAATIGSQIVITNGFQYDGHKITLVEDTNTYLCMDLNFTTLGGSTDPVNIRLYNYNYEGSVGDGYTDLIAVNAGTTTQIKLKVDNYLVDGELPGFGFAVFGGPEWNTQLEDGTYDRHSVVISNVRLEGVQEQSFDLNSATVANGTNGTGFTWANSGGVASIVDGELVVTGGFMYDAYEITFA